MFKTRLSLSFPEMGIEAPPIPAAASIQAVQVPVSVGGMDVAPMEKSIWMGVMR